jgi:hypothetical protein
MGMARFVPQARTAAVCLALILAALGAQGASAQQTTGRVIVSVLVTDNALAKRPVMVSVISGGAIVEQEEILTDPAPNQSSAVLDRVPAGACDVRVEGDGMVTEVKKGVQVFAGRDASLRAVVRPGTGVHTVEYATSAVPREEVAARLGRLEASTTALREEIARLAAALEKAKPAN